MIRERTKQKIAVVILNWMNWKDALRSIQSVLRSIEVEYELVVVENGSGNDSADQLRKSLKKLVGRNGKRIGAFEYLFPNQVTKGKIERIGKVSLLTCDANYGFSGGCNVGIHYSLLNKKIKGVFLLNSDAILESTTLKSVIGLSGNVTEGIIGCRLFKLTDKKEMFWNDSWKSVFFGSRFKTAHRNTHSEYLRVDRVDGSAMFIKEWVLKSRYSENKYYLDPRYFLYCEETDLCFYANRKFKTKCLILQNSKVFHEVSKSMGGAGNPTTSYYLTRNLFFLANTWLSKPILICFYTFRLLWLIYLSTGQFLNRGVKRWPVIAAEWNGVLDAFSNQYGKNEKYSKALKG